MSHDEQIASRPKREVFEEYMAGDHALVHIDSRTIGVSLPSHLMGQHSVTLKLSYHFNGATEHNEGGINVFLKFSGNYFECVLPWESIWGMTDEKGVRFIWADDLPKEVLLEATKSRIAEIGKKLLKPLQAIAPMETPEEEDPSTESSAAPSESTPPSAKDRRAILKRVK